jgi:hypothetical protein
LTPRHLHHIHLHTFPAFPCPQHPLVQNSFSLSPSPPLSLSLFLSLLFLSTTYSYLLLSRTLLPPTKTASGRSHGHSIVYIPAWATTHPRKRKSPKQTDRQTDRHYGNNSMP